MVKRSISVDDGTLKLDTAIICYRNKKDFNRIWRGYQSLYDRGLSLDLICFSLYKLFNYRVDEFYPNEPSLNKEAYITSLKKRMGKWPK